MPIYAVSARDPYGGLSTSYFDERGPTLRRVLFPESGPRSVGEIAYSTWYQYHEDGQLQGLENDLGDRICLASSAVSSCGPG